MNHQSHPLKMLGYGFRLADALFRERPGRVFGLRPCIAVLDQKETIYHPDTPQGRQGDGNAPSGTLSHHSISLHYTLGPNRATEWIVSDNTEGPGRTVVATLFLEPDDASRAE